MNVTVRAVFATVYCEDLPATLGFYRDRLGLATSFAFPAEGEPVFVALKAGGSELALADVRGQETGTHGLPVGPRGGQRFEVCVQVEDVDAAVGELRGAGAPVLVEPADQPWGERLAYVQDPEGNPVMLYAEAG
jgi:lactoylglutathione lyase